MNEFLAEQCLKHLEYGFVINEIYVNKNTYINDINFFQHIHKEYYNIKFNRFNTKTEMNSYIKKFIHNGLEFYIRCDDRLYYIDDFMINGVHRYSKGSKEKILKFNERLSNFDPSLYNVYSLT